MATPAAPAALAMSAINTELGLGSTTQISMSAALVRTLAGVASGAIRFSDLRGKSNRQVVTYLFNTNTANYTLTLGSTVPTSGTYVAGKSDITITINGSIYLYSTGTGTPALTIAGGASGDVVSLVNNGYIMGCGGQGAAWTESAQIAGTSGGPALSLTGGAYTLNITNNGYIGGGGGGGGPARINGPGPGGGGGGAGGGSGGQASYFFSGTSYVGSGGSGGGPGVAGVNGGTAARPGAPPAATVSASGGGGGGRIFPGSGAGSVVYNVVNTYFSTQVGGGTKAGSGGSGGGSGAVGGLMNVGSAGGGGGGWGATGGSGIWNSNPFYSGTSISLTSGAGGTGGGGGGTGSMTPATGNGPYNYISGYTGGNAIIPNGHVVSIVSGAARIYGAQT